MTRRTVVGAAHCPAIFKTVHNRFRQQVNIDDLAWGGQPLHWVHPRYCPRERLQTTVV